MRGYERGSESGGPERGGGGGRREGLAAGPRWSFWRARFTAWPVSNAVEPPFRIRAGRAWPSCTRYKAAALGASEEGARRRRGEGILSCSTASGGDVDLTRPCGRVHGGRHPPCPGRLPQLRPLPRDGSVPEREERGRGEGAGRRGGVLPCASPPPGLEEGVGDQFMRKTTERTPPGESEGDPDAPASSPASLAEPREALGMAGGRTRRTDAASLIAAAATVMGCGRIFPVIMWY